MEKETVKKIIMLQIPTSICNLRCHYCYLAQRKEAYQGEQAKMQYSPKQVAEALSKKRMGGVCFINACADGETLLTKDIDKYFKELVLEGHYLEIVTNMTISPMIDNILSWGKDLLSHIEFKCSFHYLELKQHNLLEVFANNVTKAWAAGASCTIELVPSDVLIPYIEEVRSFSMQHFGALPQLTIARDDRTIEIKKLTNLSEMDYKKTWETFGSGFWDYKKNIFGVKQKKFCYAGLWSITVNIATGNIKKCYFQNCGNIFEEIDSPLELSPIGKCPIAHCYNGHAFLTFGLIPHSTEIGYGDIRNRIKNDGTEWLQPTLKTFFNSKLYYSNEVWTYRHQKKFIKSLEPTIGIRRKLARFRFYQKMHEWKEGLK